MRIYLILLALILNCNAFAQISVIKEKTKTIQTQAYDSLTNFRSKLESGKWSYRHLKGQTLMCCVDTLRHYPFFRNVKFGDYFVVTNVQLRGDKYNHIYVENSKTHDVFYFDCENSDNSVWVVQGYYEKIKSIYLGREFVFRDLMPDNQRCNIFSFDTDSVLNSITDKSVWKCVDVSVKEKSENSLNFRSPVVIVLENPQYGKCYCSLENYLGEIFWQNIYNNKYMLLCGNFQDKDSYDKMIDEMAMEETLQAKEKAQRLSSLTKKYGSKNAKDIIDGYIRIGMTKSMCKEAWGDPDHINKTTTSYGTSEQWCYGNSYVYFEGNKIIAIQD